jgi:hypothetical protein
MIRSSLTRVWKLVKIRDLSTGSRVRIHATYEEKEKDEPTAHGINGEYMVKMKMKPADRARCRPAD